MDNRQKWYLPSTWMVGLIHLYQRLSAGKPGVCRFSPTCSAYAIDAIRRFGAIGGGWLTLCRLLRCNPLFPGGYDPVPDRFPWPWRRKP